MEGEERNHDVDSIDEIIGNQDRVSAEKRRIMKNLLFICFGFMCNFTAFQGASVLQSSLNPEIGTGSLAVIYGSLIVSAMFTPTYVIKYLGCKWTICASIVGYTTYAFANFKPIWGTLAPASIIVGLAAAPLWSAKSAYLTTSARRYAVLNKEPVEAVVNRFFGIFFLFFQFNSIIGNLISSFILSEDTSLVFPSCYNDTFIKTYCGANDCQDDFSAVKNNYTIASCGNSTGVIASDPTDETIYTLMGIYGGIGLFGALTVALFVDRIKLRQTEDRGVFELLIATFRHMKYKNQILLIAITMYSGFEQAFLTGDFTRSYITCPLAVNWVGFVLICYGACDSLFSFIFGGAQKYTGRMPLFTFAALINLALILTFQFWTPLPDNEALFFILPALWGIADAVWQTQLNAFYGVLFITNQEACFANYRLWESLGFVIAFAYQSFICVDTKLWVCLGFLIVGMACYYYIEYTEKKKAHNQVESEQADNKEKEPHTNSAFDGTDF